MTTSEKVGLWVFVIATGGIGFYLWKKRPTSAAPDGPPVPGYPGGTPGRSGGPSFLGLPIPSPVERGASSGGVPTHTVNGDPVTTPGATAGPPPAIPQPAVGPKQGDSRHVFGGTDGTFDSWSLIDEAGNLVTWKVKHGDDSRNIIWSTYQVHVSASKPTSPPTIGPLVPQPVSAATAPSYGPAKQGDSRHVYDGRSGAFDLWHLVDEVGNRNDWQTQAGDDSRNIIWSTYHVTVAASPATAGGGGGANF